MRMPDAVHFLLMACAAHASLVKYAQMRRALWPRWARSNRVLMRMEARVVKLWRGAWRSRTMFGALSAEEMAMEGDLTRSRGDAESVGSDYFDAWEALAHDES